MESTVRVDLGNQQWAIIHREILHRTYRMHEALLRRYMSPVGETKIKMSDVEKDKKLPKIDYVLDVAQIDTNEVNELYILNQVIEWSLGPVDHSTIENMLTRDQCIKLIQEMDRLYKPTPLANKGRGVIGLVRRFIKLSN
jgi:hypothetical protein